MPEGLVDLILGVVTSWQVIFVAIAFFIFTSLVSMAVSPPKVKIEKNPRVKKIKRPKEESAAISKDVDTGELGLGE